MKLLFTKTSAILLAPHDDDADIVNKMSLPLPLRYPMFPTSGARSIPYGDTCD